MEKNLIDMHIHTTCSDGDTNPKEIYKMVKERCMSVFSVTDHDTIFGAKELQKMNITDINFINGLELSVNCTFGQLHILGYGINLNNKNLNDSLDELCINSRENLKLVLERLYKINHDIRFSQEEINNIFKLQRPVNRVDLAKLFVKHNICLTVQEAFDKYLVAANAEIKKDRKGLNYKEAINLILNSGGIPVLAHNNSLKLNHEDLDDFVKTLVNIGLMGIEVYHSNFTKEDVDNSLLLARKYNLLVSGGSDYHGLSVKPRIELGTGINNNLKIKQLTLVDYINKRM